MNLNCLRICSTGRSLTALLLWTALLFGCMAAHAQEYTVLFVYDPVRHAVVSSINDASLKKFEKIGSLKKQLIHNKERTAANYMVMNVIEEHLYSKEKKLSDGNLSRLMQLYEQAVDDIRDFWDQYEQTYISSGYELREKCGGYFNRAKENSDYELGQIEHRVNSYVRMSGFLANNTERIAMMESCYDRIKAEKARVIKHGRVLFSLSVYREGFEDSKIDVLKEILGK